MGYSPYSAASVSGPNSAVDGHLAVFDGTTGHLIKDGGAAGGASMPQVDVSAFATGGSGTSGSPWTGWDTAITWTAFTEYHFRKGYFAYATSPNFALSGIHLIGEAGTYFVHTGSGDAFTMDAGAVVGSTWIQNVRVENIILTGHTTSLTGTATATAGAATVTGTGTLFTTELAVGDAISFQSGMNTESRLVTVITDNTHLTVGDNWAANQSGAIHAGKTNNGFYIRAIRNGYFNHLAAHDVANAALVCRAMVTNEFNNFRVTYHEPTQGTGYVVRPQYGIYLDTRTGSNADGDTTLIFNNPVIEGVQKKGIYGPRRDTMPYSCVFIGGTVEGMPAGVYAVDIGGDQNVFLGLDIEANANNIPSFVISGERNIISSAYVEGDINITSGTQNRIQQVRLQIGNITITSAHNIIDGVTCTNGSVIDNSGSMIRLGGYSASAGFDNRSFLDNLILRPQFLTPDGSNNVATDAATGCFFFINGITADITLLNPTNPTNGQKITWSISISGGVDRNIAYDTAFTTPQGRAFPRLNSQQAGRVEITATYSTSGGGKWWVDVDPKSDPTPAKVILTDNATINWDLWSQQYAFAQITILGGGRALNIRGARNGARGRLIVCQDGTGGRTLTLPAGSIVQAGGGGAVTLTAAANAKDMLEFFYDGTNFFWKVTLNFT
jgi:hypothetical protein